MQLLIHERMLLINILPKEGDYACLKELRRAREVLSLTEEEWKRFDARYDDGKFFWNQEKAAGYLVDVPLSEYVITLIQDDLRERNKKKKLTEQDFSLYEKFIVAYDQV